MRIAIFSETYFPYISGVNTHIKTLKEGLEEQGHKVLIVTSNPQNPQYDHEEDIFYCPGIELKKIYGYGVSNPLNPKYMKIIKRFNPDVVHIHSEFSIGMLGQLYARLYKKPQVYTLHTMYDDYLFYIAPKRIEPMFRPISRSYFKNFADRATEVIGPSEKVIEYLQRCGFKKDVNIVRNTVDLSDFLEENIDKDKVTELRKSLGINDGDVSLCFVGRLGKEKSIDTLINYFTAHFKGKNQYKLFIIGGGSEADSLTEQINSLNMQQQVKLLGRVEHDNIPLYYQACDLYVTASLSEINSISMLEAMASGLYVVHRLDEFTKNQISVGENGVLFESSEEMASFIKEEHDLSPEERASRRKTVSDSVMKYGKKEFIVKILEVYSSAIRKKRLKNKKGKTFTK